MPAIELRQPERIRDAEVEKTAAVPVPPGKNAPPKFRYVHYPDAWQHLDGVGWVPDLLKVNATPGVNGVRVVTTQAPGGAVRTTQINGAIAAHVEGGATYVDPKDKRLGEYVDYCARYPGSNGQWYHVDFCESATVLPTGQVVWDEAGAQKEWRRFLVHLRDCGILDAMLESIYRLKRQIQEEKVASLVARCEGNPRLQPRLERAQKKLEAMERDWETYAASFRKAAAAPKGKPAKAPTKSADTDEETG
jgi:hypothetical protein